MKDKLFKVLSLIDIYGRPVRLTVKGADTYKTAFGGIITILSGIALLTYFLSQFLLLFSSQAEVLAATIENKAEERLFLAKEEL